jgi:5'-nucleotidase
MRTWISNLVLRPSLVLGALVLSLGAASLGSADPPAARAAEHHLTILFNGNVQGELKDCGCKSKPLGGLARRAALIASIRAQRPHSILLDAGNLLARPGRGAVEQSQLVAELTAQMGYEVLGVGALDLANGLGTLKQVRAASGLRFVSANVVHDGELLFPAFDVLEQGELRIGLISVLDPTLRADELRRANPGLEILDPHEALNEHLPALAARADLIVLYSNLSAAGTQELLEALAADPALPQIDLAIEGATTNRYAAARTVGPTLLLAANSRGKVLGQLDLSLAADGTVIDSSYELHELVLSLPEDPQLAATVQRFEEGHAEMARTQSR